MASVNSNLRQLAGVIVLDVPRYIARIAGLGGGYLAIHNRRETLLAEPSGLGYRCDWKWTRDLHAPRVLGWLGRRMMQRALADRPVVLAEAPHGVDASPDVSFIIGHRGREREALLDATLASIAGQHGARVEAIVVEQSAEEEVRRALPSWVRYVHTPTTTDAPYNRSRAFNDGARVARGRLLVLHDNDLLVSNDYARCAIERFDAGFEAINLKRYIFYIGEADSRRLIGDRALRAVTPESIMQNAEGGGSVAIGADAFVRLGGMDESFVGWGGEDNEFWERCELVRRWEYGFLCLFHLWHAAQPQKANAQRAGAERYRDLSGISPQERVRRLCKDRPAVPHETRVREVEPDLVQRGLK